MVGSEKNEVVDYVRVYYPVSKAQEDLAREMADLIAAVMGTNQAPQHSQRWNSKHNADPLPSAKTFTEHKQCRQCCQNQSAYSYSGENNAF